MRAVIYARYSSHNQTEQSIEGQLRDAHEFAELAGITIVGEYIDRAVSGTTDNRKAFQRMIRDSEKAQFQIVLVWKLDRFARNRYDAAINRNKLRSHGVSVVSIKEDLDENNPSNVILLSVLEGMAEYYSKNLSENVKRGLRETILKGQYPGGNVPFGYTVVNKHLSANPETAPIVQEIFERYANGEQIADIIRDLNARGIRSRGKPICYSSFDRILKNTAYIGKYVFAGQIVDGCADRIVTDELYERAAVRRAAHRRAPAASRNPDVHFILLGKLFCGECGMRFTGDSGTGKNGARHHYYTCYGRKKRKTCTIASPRKDEVEYFICRVISDFLMDANRPCLEIMAEEIAKIVDTGFEMQEVHQLEQRLSSLESKLAALVDTLASTPAPLRPTIISRMESLEKERSSTEADLVQRRLYADDHVTKADILNFLRLMVTDLENEENRIFILDRFLHSAYLYNDGRLEIYMSYIQGHPHCYDPNDPDDPDNNPPPKGYPSEGKKIFDGNYKGPPLTLPDIRRGSSLLSYALPNADKDEPRLPHVFFLRKHIGIVTWITKVCN